MPVPSDPFDFANGTTADADQVDLRFKRLYDALNPAIQGIDETNLSAALRTKINTIPTQGPGPVSTTPSVVSSLPSSPTDGQEVYYDLGVGGLWHLRYRSALSGSSYKWQFLGGPPLVQFGPVSLVVTSVTPSGTWFDAPVPTVLNLPLGGAYVVQYATNLTVFPPAATSGTAPDNNVVSASLISQDSSRFLVATVPAMGGAISSAAGLSVLASPGWFKLQYQVSAAGGTSASEPVHISSPVIMATPQRVG